jgi:serine/threonine protein kinase
MDWGTYEDRFKFIVISAYGNNLEQVFRDNKRSFKKIDVLKMGIQMVKIIEKLHSIGYIHGGIRPDSFVIPQNIVH